MWGSAVKYSRRRCEDADVKLLTLSSGWGSGVIQLGSGREVPKTFRILYFAAGKMLKMSENGLEVQKIA